jgi:hypothetical protein
MRKQDELKDPNSCINKAYDDEETFVLMARDVVAPDLIRVWCDLRVANRKNTFQDPQIRDAMQTAAKMENQYAEIRGRMQPCESTSTQRS